MCVCVRACICLFVLFMVSLEHSLFFFTSVQYIMYVHACHISLLYVYFSAGRQYLGDSDSEIWCCVKYTMCVCVRAQDIFALAEVTWIWSTFLFLGVSLPSSPPLSSPPLPSPPLLSSLPGPTLPRAATQMRL